MPYPAPKWIIIVVGLIGCLWIIPIIGIVATSLQSPDAIARGWWHFSENDFTLNAWRMVWKTIHSRAAYGSRPKSPCLRQYSRC